MPLTTKDRFANTPFIHPYVSFFLLSNTVIFCITPYTFGLLESFISVFILFFFYYYSF